MASRESSWDSSAANDFWNPPIPYATPREKADDLVTDYIEDAYLYRNAIPDVDRSLTWAENHCKKFNMDLSSLFWSTQSKLHQLSFRLGNASYELDLSDQDEFFLCAKCGNMVPGHAFEPHLNLRELVQYSAASLEHSRSLPDCSYHCRLAHQQQTSQEVMNLWFVHHLVKPDWPTFCPKCHCILMHSTLPLHLQSSVFCRHAWKAIEVNSGFLSRDRFSHYPGHPLTHLYFVGKWPVAAMARLYDGELATKTMLFMSYIRVLALSRSLYGFYGLNVPVLRLVLSFLCRQRRARFVQYADLLDSVLNLILSGKYRSAKRLVCLYARISVQQQLSDRFGISMSLI